MTSRDETIRKKAKTVKRIALVGSILSILVIAYGISVFYSVFRTNFDFANVNYNYVYDDNGTPLNFTDDSINASVSIPITNNGLYAINSINIAINIIIPTCPGLADNTTVGTANVTIPSLARGAYINYTIPITYTNNITILQAIYLNNPSKMIDFDIITSIQIFQIGFAGNYTIS